MPDAVVDDARGQVLHLARLRLRRHPAGAHALGYLLDQGSVAEAVCLVQHKASRRSGVASCTPRRRAILAAELAGWQRAKDEACCAARSSTCVMCKHSPRVGDSSESAELRRCAIRALCLHHVQDRSAARIRASCHCPRGCTPAPPSRRASVLLAPSSLVSPRAPSTGSCRRKRVSGVV